MDREVIIITGTVGDIVYKNAANGYTVASVETETALYTAVGTMPDLCAGETVRVTGTLLKHRTYGEQLAVLSYERTVPEGAEQILKYLSSGAIPGIGPKRAMTIIEKFGADALDVIENSPGRLSSIKGISSEKATEISENFRKQASLRAVMLQLQKYALTPVECVRVHKLLGAEAVRLVTENPYCLCSLGIGIDFERAEQIEKLLEKPPAPSLRTDEGVLHTLRHNLYTGGHTCVPRDKLIVRAAEYLRTDRDSVDVAIDRLIGTLRACVDTIDGEDFIFLPSSYRYEKSIAKRIGIIMRFPPPRSSTLMADIKKIEDSVGIVYEQRQREAVMTAVTKGLLVLTGGPGTGKTTALKGILSLYEKQKLTVALAAPTGRAAQRMSEVTGREAKTIHRLLEVQWDEYDQPTFTRNTQNPLDCQAVILDELSMIDISLFSAFLDALPLGCRLVMVGDSDQLPPVGAGNVLKDIIDSGVLPMVRLETVFRQALESAIIRNAHKIVAGEMPELSNTGETDFFHLERPAPSSAAETIADLFCRRLPNAYHYDPLRDIQVLCPSKKGASGTRSLNSMLQDRLNPPAESKKEYRFGGNLLREGDKVMQTKNDYQIEWEKGGEQGLGVFNGDIGVLKSIAPSLGNLIIDFDGRVAAYPFEAAEELELAYAVTVHKSQGSEFKAVIIAAAGIAPQLTYRNLLYTAVTRARERCLTVGAAAELQGMVENDRKSKRYSALKYFLVQENAP